MKRKSLVSYLALALILTACGTSNSANQLPKSEDQKSPVSQQVFDAALSKVEFIIDEFDGSWEIFDSPEKQNIFKKASGPRDSRYVLMVQLYIVRDSSDAPLDARVTINFLSTECMNIYQWDTKSKNGVVNFDMASNLLECEPQEGYSDVRLESANKYMTESEMLNYCKIINGEDVTVRILGFDGILSHKGSMPKTVVSAHRNICVVYLGLLNGLSPKLS